MLNIFKMDMRRMLRSKAFYICLVGMNLITGTMIFTGVVPSFATVMGDGGSGDMMGSMMGIGMALMFIGILFAIHICSEFSTGFAKNVFARHASPLRYIGGKLLSLTVTGAIMIVIYMAVSMMMLTISGAEVVLQGGIGGLLVFLIEKIFVCCAFAAIILMVCLLTHKSAVGVIVAIIVSLGVVPMLLNLIGNYFGLTWVSSLTQYTISGLFNQASLVFSGSTLVISVIGSLAWTAVCSVLGNRAARLKDI